MKHDEEDEPLDPKVEAIRRRMVRLLMISSGTMILGFMAVVAAIVYKATTDVPAVVEAVNKGRTGDVSLPTNARIMETSLDGDRILLRLRLEDGSRELHIMTVMGQPVSILRLGSAE